MNNKTSEAQRSRASLSNNRPIPPSLAKRGIARVTDNLDGREIELPANTLSIFFGKEILRALEARRLARAGQLPTPRMAEVEQRREQLPSTEGPG